MIGLIVALTPWLRLVETHIQIQFMRHFFQKDYPNPKPDSTMEYRTKFIRAKYETQDYLKPSLRISSKSSFKSTNYVPSPKRAQLFCFGDGAQFNLSNHGIVYECRIVEYIAWHFERGTTPLLATGSSSPWYIRLLLFFLDISSALQY